MQLCPGLDPAAPARRFPRAPDESTETQDAASALLIQISIRSTEETINYLLISSWCCARIAQNRKPCRVYVMFQTSHDFLKVNFLTTSMSVVTLFH